MSRPSYTDRRRRMLARRVERLDQLETRSTITEPLGMHASLLGIAVGAAAVARGAVGDEAPAILPTGGDAFDQAVRSARRPGRAAGYADLGPAGEPMPPLVLLPPLARHAGRGTPDRFDLDQQPAPGTADDWLSFSRRRPTPEIPAAADAPTTRPGTAQGGGDHAGAAAGATSPAGGPARGAITPLRLPAPAASPPASGVDPAATATVVTAPAAPAAWGGSDAGTAAEGPTGAATLDASTDGSGSTATVTAFGGIDSGGALPEADLLAGLGDGGDGLAAFTHFPLYTLDHHRGVVLFDGMAMLGEAGRAVDLRAQVRDVDAVTYSWDTSQLDNATSISGTSTYRLQFTWGGTIPTAQTDSVTLTVTDTINNVQEQQTYHFFLPPDTFSGSGGGSTTWPGSFAPDTVLPDGPSFASHHVDVAANSGALETRVVLPSYSPNFAPLALEYDSVAADPRPIVLVHHELAAGQTVPTKVSASLTFHGSAGSTYYYDTSQFTAGDVQQVALQADATALATGRYAYTATVADHRASVTTVTYTGTATVVSTTAEPFASLGRGWSLAGLNRLHAVTGGVILDTGSDDRLWFASGGGGSGGGSGYTSPAGDFSALVKNGDGSYTRTLTDGTKQQFNASGYQTATVDRNGLRVTFTYSSNRLSTITDPYGKLTTFTYAGGQLRTIQDPANRLTTFTFSGTSLTGVERPDGGDWAYAYDGSGRMTGVTDPRSKAVTIAYDAAHRVGTVTRPDLTTDAFTAYQVRGFDTTGTSGSPAPATLMAEARATRTDPLGHATDLRPDRRGLGTTTQGTDGEGNVATAVRDTKGLATITVDPANRITRNTFDAKGNLTQGKYHDDTSDQYTYNGFAQVTKHVDARGKVTTSTYDVEGNLTGVEDPLHHRTTMTYTANGRVATVKDARSNVTTYQYDSQDRLTTVTHPGGATTKVAYDTQGNVATLTDERGHSTTYAYDALNRLTGQKDALGNRVTYTYDSGGNLTQAQEPLSRTTAYAYDALNRVTTITAPLARTTVLAYDAGGNLQSVKDPLNRRTTFEYDAANRRTVTIDPLSKRTTVTYHADGQVATVADRLDRVTTTTYDERGRVESVTDPLNKTTTYTYTATGNPGTITLPNSGGTLIRYTYDDADRLVEVKDALDHRTTTAYDAVGNVTAEIDPNGNRTTYTYDARNRLETVVDANSNVTTFVYDSGGNRTVVVDPLGNRTTTAYDALDRATTITDALGGQTTIAYDAAGRQTGLTDPNGNRTTWAYDAADRLTTMTDALGTATSSYDAADQLTDQTDRLGRRVTFAYDSGGRMINEKWHGTGSRTITYTYDAEAQLTGVKDPDATLTFTYDSGGRQLTQRTSSTAGQPNVLLTSGFDEIDQRTSLTDNLSSVGRTTFSYDAGNRLTTITRSLGGTAGPQVVFGYDAADRRTSASRTLAGSGTAVTTTLAYDAGNRLTTLTHQTGSGTALASYVYAYDDANRVTGEVQAWSAGGGGSATVTYTYDDTHQLTAADRAGTSSDESYGYDSGGNRDTTGYTTTTGNRLSASPGVTYTYDAEGNLSSKTVLNGAGTGDDVRTDYAWDHRNRLVAVTRRAPGGGSVDLRVTYTYDGLDRRIGTKTDADGDGAGAAVQTWTVYDGVNPYADFNSAGTLQTRYLHGPAIDELLARTSSGGTTAWYLPDKLGTVRDIASTAGAVIYHAEYDAFGNVTSESGGGSGDRFKFTGRELDGQTGLYYYRARYYHAQTGRFISRDPKGFAAGDANLYRYVGNGSTNFVDPTGLDSGGAIGGGIAGGGTGVVVGGVVGGPVGAVIGGTVGAISGAIYGYFYTTGYAQGAVSGMIWGAVAGIGGGAYAAYMYETGYLGAQIAAYREAARVAAQRVAEQAARRRAFNDQMRKVYEQFHKGVKTPEKGGGTGQPPGSPRTPPARGPVQSAPPRQTPGQSLTPKPDPPANNLEWYRRMMENYKQLGDYLRDMIRRPRDGV